LPTIIEEPVEDEYYWDPNYYCGFVDNDDPFDYSDVGARYYAWKDIEWVTNGGTGFTNSDDCLVIDDNFT
jgi:hypothetical protein